MHFKNSWPSDAFLKFCTKIGKVLFEVLAMLFNHLGSQGIGAHGDMHLQNIMTCPKSMDPSSVRVFSIGYFSNGPKTKRSFSPLATTFRSANDVERNMGSTYRSARDGARFLPG